MSSALEEVVDNCNEFSNNFKRKLSSSEEICDKKPKLLFTESSSDLDNSTVKSSKNEELEKINQKRNGFKQISSDSHDGDDAENGSTVTKLKSNKSDNECSDDKPLTNSKSKIIATCESYSEDSDSDSCLKSSKDENQCSKILRVNLQKISSVSSDECIDSSGKLKFSKVSKKAARIKRNSKPTLKIRSKNTTNVSTSDSSDDEPLSIVSQSKIPEKNAVSDDDKSSKKLGSKPCKSVPIQKGVNVTMNQRNSKYGEYQAKQKVAATSDSEDDELMPVKDETSGDSSDGYQMSTSKIKKDDVTRKRAGNKKIANTKIGMVFSESDSSITDLKSRDERDVSSKKSKQRKKYISFKKSKMSNSKVTAASNNRKRIKNKDVYSKEYKPIHSSSASNNNSEDESNDKSHINSSEEMQENPKGVKLKQVKNTADLSEDNHNKNHKEKSPELKFKKLSSVSDTESSVVSDEDVNEQKPRKLIQASKNMKSKISNAEEETSDKEDNLKSQVVKHEISSSESNSDDYGMKKSPDENAGSDSNQNKEQIKSKKAPEDDKRIIHLKKYLHVAGIRPKNYAELWKGCRSNKARVAKLLELLENNGLKGRPTIEKCKKLKIKIETKKEIAELDLGNIMDDGGVGRSRRCTRGVLVSANSHLSAAAAEKAEELKNRFSRIKALNSSNSESD